MIWLYLKWKVSCQLNRLPDLPVLSQRGDPAEERHGGWILPFWGMQSCHVLQATE